MKQKLRKNQIEIETQFFNIWSLKIFYIKI